MCEWLLTCSFYEISAHKGVLSELNSLRTTRQPLHRSCAIVARAPFQISCSTAELFSAVPFYDLCHREDYAPEPLEMADFFLYCEECDEMLMSTIYEPVFIRESWQTWCHQKFIIFILKNSNSITNIFRNRWWARKAFWRSQVPALDV